MNICGLTLCVLRKQRSLINTLVFRGTEMVNVKLFKYYLIKKKLKTKNCGKTCSLPVSFLTIKYNFCKIKQNFDRS